MVRSLVKNTSSFSHPVGSRDTMALTQELVGRVRFRSLSHSRRELYLWRRKEQTRRRAAVSSSSTSSDSRLTRDATEVGYTLREGPIFAQARLRKGLSIAGTNPYSQTGRRLPWQIP